MSVERVAEMEEFWEFIKKTRRTLRPGSLETPEMAVAILDTNVYIDHWERGLYRRTLENLRRAYIIRHAAVVLTDLRRGARGREASDLLRAFSTCYGPMEASGADQWEAGRLVRSIGDKQDWGIKKRRYFQTIL